MESNHNLLFDVEKCRVCSRRKGCYKDGAKSKTYSLSIKTDEQKEQLDFQQTEEFKKKARERYKIEAKTQNLNIPMDMTGHYHMDCHAWKCRGL